MSKITSSWIDSKRSFLTDHYISILKLSNHEGALIDPDLNDPLLFQYQYGYNVLSSSILAKHNNSSDYLNNSKKTLEFYKSIPYEQKKLAQDFNIFPLFTATIICRDNGFSDHIHNYLKYDFTPFNEDYLNKFSATDFTLYHYINRILKAQNENNKEEVQWYSTKLKNYIKSIIGVDGIFIDAYKAFENRKEYALVYHIKNIKLLTLFSHFIGDEVLQDQMESIFYNSLQLISDTGHLNYFGRSTHSSYGNACLFFLLLFYSKKNDDTGLFPLADHLANNIFHKTQKNGLIGINESSNQKLRPGFDNYMYQIVYNSYTNAVCLLGLELFDQLTPTKKTTFQLNNGISQFENSGFVKLKNEQFSASINLRGNPEKILAQRDDPRYPILSFNYLTSKGVDLIPSFPFVQKMIRGSKLKKVISFARWFFINSPNNNSPIKSGYIPCIKIKRILFIPHESTVIKETENIIELKLGYKKAITWSNKLSSILTKTTYIDQDIHYRITLQDSNIILDFEAKTPSEFIFPIRLIDSLIQLNSNVLTQQINGSNLSIGFSYDFKVINEFKGQTSTLPYKTLVTKATKRIKKATITLSCN